MADKSARELELEIALHDVNNLLTAVGGFVARARNTPGIADDVKQTLTRASTGVRRCILITQSLGQQAQKSANKSFDITEALTLAIEMLPEQFAHSVKIICDPNIFNSGAGPLLVSGNLLGVYRIFTNLFINACQALDESSVPSGAGLIRISLSVTDKTVDIAVLDNGPGVPQVIREKLFSEAGLTTKHGATKHGGANKSRGATGQLGGAGLGLYGSRLLIEQMSGSLKLADSAAGSGAHFIVSLPKA